MRIQSAAKINLVLNVLGKRADGYHELRMVMQSVSLYDYLDFARSDKLEVIAPAGLTENIQENLVYRAARTFLDKYIPTQSVRITLTKNIPMAAGLAGGSTDCAGTLIGLNKFFELNLPLTELETIANSLGSDIAYCLYGGTFLAQGRGEQLTKLPEIPKLYGLIIKPPFTLSTAAVYKQFRGQNKSAKIQDYIEGKIDIRNLPLSNDLIAPALELQPELIQYFQIIENTQPIAYQMSGSGPAIAAFYADDTARDNALLALKSHEVYPVETVPSAQNILAD